MCNENGRLSLPVIGQLQGEASEIADQAVYAFSVDESQMFLIPGKAMADRIPEGSSEGMEYVDIRELYDRHERWPALAAVTARHLDHWYGGHRYCGCWDWEQYTASIHLCSQESFGVSWDGLPGGRTKPSADSFRLSGAAFSAPEIPVWRAIPPGRLTVRRRTHILSM